MSRIAVRYELVTGMAATISNVFNINSAAFNSGVYSSNDFSVTRIDHSLYLNFTPEAAAVPEPSTLVIWSLLGVAGLVARRRRGNNIASKE